MESGETPAEKIRHGFRRCVSRPPSDAELNRLVQLFETTASVYAGQPENAARIATMPIGAAPEGTDLAQLAALTVVGNVLLNLDEMLMKR
jgi:hypothetical protein